jgi:hypothetical protein
MEESLASDNGSPIASSHYSRGTAPFFLVIWERRQPRMPQVLFRRPLHKLELPDEHRLQPPAVFHLRRGQAFAPPGAYLRQVRERTLGNLQPPELLLQLLPHGRCEPTPSPRSVHQPIALPIPEDEGIEVTATDRVAADHEPLGPVTRILTQAPERSPGSYLLSRRFATRPSRPCSFTERIKFGRLASRIGDHGGSTGRV